MERSTWTVVAASTFTAASLLLLASPASGQSTPNDAPAATRQPPSGRGRLGNFLNRSRTTDPAVAPTATQAPFVGGDTAFPGAPAAVAPTPVTGAVETLQSGAATPELPSPDELQAPTIVLPTAPMEPYLLTRRNGPFMVLAHTFRGPDAARYAQALAIELRNEHGLPAYVFFNRIQPGHSNIHNVPPTARPEIQSSESMTAPETYRSYDEAAVLVGDCKTIDDSEKVLKQVKKIRSTTLDGLPSLFEWRKKKGLSRAMLTTNPLVASEELFPAQERGAAVAHLASTGRAAADSDAIAAPGAAVDPSVVTAAMIDDTTPQNVRYVGPSTVVIQGQAVSKVVNDPLVKRMNAGGDSLLNCPGNMVLEVASFTGRSSVDLEDRALTDQSFLGKGPLAVAADQATHLVDSLKKCKKLPAGVEVYVYHDRTASRVYIGPFESPQDPRLLALLDRTGKQRSILDDVSLELLSREFTTLPLAPSNQLTPVPR